jgi:hypothetical protein
VLATGIVASVANVAVAVARLITLEVVKALRAPSRQRTMVAISRVKAVVDVAIKAVRAVEPWASSKKYSADKPVGPIVAVR